MGIKDRLIFALDVNTKEDAIYFAKLLKDRVGCFKVGLELFTSCGPEIVNNIKEYGEVFLDLKLFDIPNTVLGAAKAAEKMEVDYLTVANLDALYVLNVGIKILAVPRLTSDKVVWLDLKDNLYEKENVSKIKYSKAYGLVCGGQYVNDYKELCKNIGCFNDIKYIVPGIRLPLEDEHDQVVVSTPDYAIRNGADKIVVGRSIRMAEDPIKAADKVLELISKGLEDLK